MIRAMTIHKKKTHINPLSVRAEIGFALGRTGLVFCFDPDGSLMVTPCKGLVIINLFQ